MDPHSMVQYAGRPRIAALYKGEKHEEMVYVYLANEYRILKGSHNVLLKNWDILKFIL
jgi:hypothetical protein